METLEVLEVVEELDIVLFNVLNVEVLKVVEEKLLIGKEVGNTGLETWIFLLVRAYTELTKSTMRL
jgi:hypothetical protein